LKSADRDFGILRAAGKYLHLKFIVYRNSDLAGSIIQQRLLSITNYSRGISLEFYKNSLIVALGWAALPVALSVSLTLLILWTRWVLNICIYSHAYE